MLGIFRILNPFGSARGRAASKRRSRAQQPCVSRLEARALLASFQGLGAGTDAAAVSADGSVIVGNLSTGVHPLYGPFYWTQESGLIFLRDSSGNIFEGIAASVSENGSV